MGMPSSERDSTAIRFPVTVPARACLPSEMPFAFATKWAIALEWEQDLQKGTRVYSRLRVNPVSNTFFHDLLQGGRNRCSLRLG